MIMPFELTNAHSDFMHLMNHILRHFIGKFVVVYFDNILVYRLNMHDNIEPLENVLQVPREEKLYSNLEKYNFSKARLPS